MGIFSNCLLVSDIDGTLKDREGIPSKNIEMIEYFKKEGGKFTIATGRGPSVAKGVCKEAHVNCPVLLSNGSVIYDVEKDEILSIQYLPKSAKYVTNQVAENFQGVGIQITLDDKLVNLADNVDTQNYRSRVGNPYLPVTFEEIKDIPWVKVLVMASDEELLKSIKKFMAGLKREEFQYIVTSPSYYEIHIAGMNKSVNINKLLEMSDIPNGKVFAIGDYYNDFEMVKSADIGAFLPETPEELKPYADFISCSVREGAVGHFIEYLANKLKNNSKG